MTTNRYKRIQEGEKEKKITGCISANIYYYHKYKCRIK